MHRAALHAHQVIAFLRLRLMLVLPILVILLAPAAEAGPQVIDRYIQLENAEPTTITRHAIGFRYTNFTSQVASVSFEYCANSPIPQIVCIPPAGLDVNAASFVSQSGQTGFSVNSTETTANKVVITRAAQQPNAPNALSRYEFSNMINPSSIGSYYVRIQTYSTSDATGVAIEDGGIVFAINDAFNVAAEVPPHLTMCAAVTITGLDCSSANSYFIDLGEFSRSSATAATSELLVTTNAGFGFSVTLAGTTLTSGNNLINPLFSQSTSSPGTSQFGLNLRANSSPGIGANPTGPGVATVASDYAVANRFKFMPGDAVVSANGTSDFRKFTVSYVTNISASQPAGIYATTVSYIALANF